MNTLVAVGTSAAYFFSVAAVVAPGLFTAGGLKPDLYFDTSAVIIALILFGRLLESRPKAAPRKRSGVLSASSRKPPGSFEAAGKSIFRPGCRPG